MYNSSMWSRDSQSMFCTADSGHCYVGFAVEGQGGGRVVRTLDSGRSWSVVSNTTANYSSLILVAAQGLVGAGDDAALITNLAADTATTTPWTTPASAWTSFAAGATKRSLNSLSLAGIASVVAVGDVGAIIRSIDLGQSWSSVSSPTIRHLTGVCFQTNASLFSHSGGQYSMYTGVGSNPVYNSVIYGTANLTALDLPLVDGFAVGAVGTVLYSNDSGRSWRQQNASTSVNLNAVACIGGGRAVAVGSAGTILRTTNNGATWVRVSCPVTSSLFAVEFGSDSGATNALGVIVGASGVLLVSYNLGLSWVQRAHSLGSVLMFGVDVVSSSVAVVASRSKVLTTLDGGVTWAAGEEIFDQSTNTSINYITDLAIFMSPSFSINANTKSVSIDTITAPVTVTFLISNKGTIPLIVHNVSLSSPALLISEVHIGSSDAIPAFTYDIPFRFVVDYNLFEIGSTTISVEFTHNAPTQRHNVSVVVVLREYYSNSQPSVFQKYWYLFLVLGLIFAALTFHCGRQFIARRHKRKQREAFQQEVQKAKELLDEDSSLDESEPDEFDIMEPPTLDEDAAADGFSNRDVADSERPANYPTYLDARFAEHLKSVAESNKAKRIRTIRAAGGDANMDDLSDEEHSHDDHGSGSDSGSRSHSHSQSDSPSDSESRTRSRSGDDRYGSDENSHRKPSDIDPRLDSSRSQPRKRRTGVLGSEDSVSDSASYSDSSHSTEPSQLRKRNTRAPSSKLPGQLTSGDERPDERKHSRK